jgi:hypothetical protein
VFDFNIRIVMNASFVNLAASEDDILAFCANAMRVHQIRIMDIVRSDDQILVLQFDLFTTAGTRKVVVFLSRLEELSIDAETGKAWC